MQVATAFAAQTHGYTSYHDWRVPRARLAIEPTHVHVWRINLDDVSSTLAETVISHDERGRAARYRFAHERKRFVAARAAMRTILSRYLEAEPRRLEFESNPFGKPFLIDGYGARGLHFNLSHSYGLALLAVARGREVGIDVEFIRADVATDEVAENFFSRAEVQKLHALPRESRAAAFFNCWTRKEAYIKGRGEGLSLPLDLFDVSLSSDEAPTLTGHRLDPAEVWRWSFSELFPAPGYAATLAVEGNFTALKLWDFSAIG